MEVTEEKIEKLNKLMERISLNAKAISDSIMQEFEKHDALSDFSGFTEEELSNINKTLYNIYKQIVGKFKD